MKVAFKTSFAKDLRKIKNTRLKKQVGEIIELVEKSHSFQEVKNSRKIIGTDHYYRIRIGDYRMGLAFENDTVVFVRFLHRKEIYRYFP